MPCPSELLQEAYSLTLSPAWKAWFDHDLNALLPPGAMREVVQAEQLVESVPSQIWPGFMLPDTLPIIGNAYGDWLCARIDENNRFGELIYWYHGGGDWIPVGNGLAEALLHDAVDHFRPIRKQAVRGAKELEKTEDAALLERLSESSFQNWLVENLPHGQNEANPIDFVRGLADHLATGDYSGAIQRLYSFNWAAEALACDLIEEALQAPLAQIANSAFAEKHGYNWYPEFVAWMFDLNTMPAETIEHLQNLPDNSWPQQNWDKAAAVANRTLSVRSDLGWAFTVSGWEQERAGDIAGAAKTYFAGRYASSFADQSVRLSCHSLSERMGKFCVERLAQLLDKGSIQASTDDYLQLFLGDSEQSLLARLHTYWWDKGQEQLEHSDYAGAYQCFMRSGWDMGVSRLSDYANILEALHDSASRAGWHARAAVAKKHWDCLKR